ncbi:MULTISPECIES: DUF2141 domain-containing protein [unclassified Aureispira]|uniref:DUF2141 domain-containing protein n=1 Tax=unclassified Aureispira TaxID=2649989 RepID=UPI0006980431|nr:MULTISPECIES: DUF2141 domain-containing protein [unclassified Aureispira]WMX16412.1 DUF2141 domain-containing protein [Aureispira sp. CCB-E]
MKPICIFLLSTIALFFSTAFSWSYLDNTPIVEVVITNIRNNKGNLVLGFYKDGKSFSKRTPFMSKVVEKTTMKNGIVKFSLPLPAGKYGIALLDDENKNGKADYGFLLPIEGFGFSDYYHSGVLAPTFNDFDFEVGNTDKSVTVKLKYM